MRLRTIVISLLVIVILIPVVALAALSMIDPNRFKPEIAAEVEKATGRTLTIDGDISLDIGLKPRVQVNDVRFANAPWGTSATMADIARIDVVADLMPLLGGKIVINRIELVEPAIFLETNDQGVGNWQFGDRSAKPDHPSAESDHGGGGDPTIPLVQNLIIERGEFRYLDGVSGAQNDLLLDQVTLEAQNWDEPVTLSAIGSLDGGPIDIRGQSGSVNQLLDGAASIPVDLTASALGIEASLNGEIADPQHGRGIDLQFKAQAESFAQFQSLAALPDLPVSLDQIGPFLLEGTVAGSADALQISGLKLALDALDLAVRAEGGLGLASGAADTGIDFSVQADDLTTLADTLDAPIPNQPLSLTARIEGDPAKAVNINNIAFSFGPNDLAGQATIDLTGKRPAVTAELAGSQLDLAVLASPAAAAAPDQPTESAAQDRIFPDDPLPLDGLNAIDADIKLKLGKLITTALSLDDLDASLTLDDGKLRLEPLTFGLADSQPSIALTLDQVDQGLNLDLRVNADQFNYGKLLAQIGITELLEGSGDIAVDLDAQGGSVAALAASLDGTITTLIGKGRVRTAFLDTWIGGLGAAADTIFQNSDGKWVVLECLALDLASNDGIVVPRAMLLNTEHALINGEGEFDLGKETLGLVVTPQSKSATLNLALPVKISGSMLTPSFGIDEAGAARRVGSLLGAAVFPPAALGAFVDLGAGEDHPCLNPSTEPSSSGGLDAIAKEPAKVLETLKDDPKKALEETGKSLLKGLLGGN